MKKKSQPCFCKSLGGKLLPWILSALLVCSLCGSSVFAMDGGEAGITPDPPTDIGNSTPDPDPQPEPEPPAESSSTPSSTPSNPNSSESSSSSGGSSSASSSSSENESGGSSQTSSDSNWNSESSSSSSSSSRPNGGGNTSSSKTSYPDPDPNKSYVEYIPPKNNGNDNNGHTTSAQNPVAIAPSDDNTEILSSQNWDELLSMDSNVSSSTESASSSLPSIGGIFGKNNNTGGGISIILILGIVLLVLGTGGIGFFIYSQFIYKRRKGKGADSAENYEDSYLDYEDEDDGYDDYNEYYPPTNYRAKGDTAPLRFEKSDRDISSFSDPTMKPSNPIQPPPAKPPAQPSRQVEDIDWDQFFRDNQEK